MCQIATILEVACARIRECERPADSILLGPGHHLMQVRFQMNDRSLPTTIGQLGVIRPMNHVEHDRAGAEIERHAAADAQIRMA